jgi:hypothetical protein
LLRSPWLQVDGDKPETSDLRLDDLSRDRATLCGVPKSGAFGVLMRMSKFYGQATKGAWWMPWQKKAMKDVASCDKPRGAANRH